MTLPEPPPLRKSAFDYAVGETKETLKAILRIKVILPCALFVCHCDSCSSFCACISLYVRTQTPICCLCACLDVRFIEMQVSHQHLIDRVTIFASCISAPLQCPLISLTRTCPFAFPSAPFLETSGGRQRCGRSDSSEPRQNINLLQSDRLLVQNASTPFNKVLF